MTWDNEFAALLDELSTVQTEMLAVLNQKRQLLASVDATGLEAVQPAEAALVQRLQACQDRRQLLLQQATSEGRPAKNLRQLAQLLPNDQRRSFEPRVKTAQMQAKLLQNQALTNWVIAQKTLIHLSQMLEIIATGGQVRPTYGEIGETANSGGLLLDQVG
jgi:hypothetical protein